MGSCWRGLQLFHSILGSLLSFAAIQSGADSTYGRWLGWFGYTLLFNVPGGIILVTLPRPVRAKELIDKRRTEAPGDPDTSPGYRLLMASIPGHQIL